MAVTRLKRKDRKNKARANNKQIVIKQLLRTPVIKNVDVEELKAQFGKPGIVSRATAAIKETAHNVVEKAEAVIENVKETVENALNKDEANAAE